jgi:small nuclear ribonucleoprotein (snRNP)-like protein
MIANKIVVKYKDGKIVKGWSTDFGPNKEIFHLHPLEEYGKDALEIEISSLKAVFFVKDYKGDKDYKKVRTFEGQPQGVPSQRKIIIIFKDGENFYGTTHSYDPERKGFFVYPIDPKQRRLPNIRIRNRITLSFCNSREIGNLYFLSLRM